MAEITLMAKLENLELVTAFVNAQLEKADCSPKLIAQVDVAVEEIYVNITNYAYHPEEGEATIRCEVGGDPLQVSLGFTDRGKPYNPLLKEDPDITKSAGERPIGGLGIFMVKKLMDEIQYDFRDGKNILTIIKKV